MNGTPQCFAANRPTGSHLHEEESTTFAPVLSRSFFRRASSFLSTMYGNLRGFGVLSLFKTPSMSRNMTFMTGERTAGASGSKPQRVVPAKAGTHNHRVSGQARWLPQPC